ncbi:unnamed protein product [Prorocentrum cordatum]|uniref:Uncharacterized protein n=1 Tax=Prorocentrum cordatum TaxID=2364126 RepID=A0ABN9UU84_9DINO|nr:unnamed protein product [Polarella glacialis]
MDALPTRTAGPQLTGHIHCGTSYLQSSGPSSEPAAHERAASMQFDFSALLLDPQRLIAAHLDLITLGRLAACNVGLGSVTAAPALWARHLDSLGVRVCPSMGLGCSATLPWRSGPPTGSASGGARAGSGSAEPGRAALLPGARVRLHGLVRAELNGEAGIVSAPPARTGRIPVRLDGGGCSASGAGAPGRQLLVRPENLEALGPASVGAAAPGDPRRLLQGALQALRANEEFYAAFRAGDARRMRALWLDESSLGGSAAVDLLGAASPQDGRTVSGSLKASMAHVAPSFSLDLAAHGP